MADETTLTDPLVIGEPTISTQEITGNPVTAQPSGTPSTDPPSNPTSEPAPVVPEASPQPESGVADPAAPAIEQAGLEYLGAPDPLPPMKEVRAEDVLDPTTLAELTRQAGQRLTPQQIMGLMGLAAVNPNLAMEAVRIQEGSKASAQRTLTNLQGQSAMFNRQMVREENREKLQRDRLGSYQLRSTTSAVDRMEREMGKAGVISQQARPPDSGDIGTNAQNMALYHSALQEEYGQFQQERVLRAEAIQTLGAALDDVANSKIPFTSEEAVRAQVEARMTGLGLTEYLGDPVAKKLIDSSVGSITQAGKNRQATIDSLNETRESHREATRIRNAHVQRLTQNLDTMDYLALEREKRLWTQSLVELEKNFQMGIGHSEYGAGQGAYTEEGLEALRLSGENLTNERAGILKAMHMLDSEIAVKHPAIALPAAMGQGHTAVMGGLPPKQQEQYQATFGNEQTGGWKNVMPGGEYSKTFIDNVKNPMLQNFLGAIANDNFGQVPPEILQMAQQDPRMQVGMQDFEPKGEGVYLPWKSD